MAIFLANKRMIGPANLVLDDTIRVVENNISSEVERSRIYGNIAAVYARLAQYHTARVTADKAEFASDIVNGYMAILKYYAIEKNPELTEQLTMEEEGEF